MARSLAIFSSSTCLPGDLSQSCCFKPHPHTTLSATALAKTFTLNSRTCFTPNRALGLPPPPQASSRGTLFQSMATPLYQLLRPKLGVLNLVSFLILHIQSASKTSWLFLKTYTESSHFSLFSLPPSWTKALRFLSFFLFFFLVFLSF